MNVRRVVTGPTPDGKTVAPQSATLEKDLDIPRALAELEAKLPGLASHMEVDSSEPCRLVVCLIGAHRR